MKFNPDIHHRRSIRLKKYDYSQDGAYFVTICCQNRERSFGDIADGKMVLNDAGNMVDKWWRKLSDKYMIIEIDEYCIMPNHVHGIIVINDGCNVGANLCIRPYKNPGIPPDMNPGICPNMRKGENVVSPLQNKIPNNYLGLGRYISWFKRMTTNEYIRCVKSDNWQPFDRKLWQRNYYEHIIRNEEELNRVREYVNNNPIEWNSDEDNPINAKY